MNLRTFVFGLCLTHTMPLFAQDYTLDREIENLQAFARLYGYVRFFHPTDAAANTDWDRFAIHGSSVVRDAAESGELAARLRDLFSPIAPTVTIYDRNVGAESAASQVSSARCRMRVVVWQHRGVGLGAPGPYRSVRTNRDSGAGQSRFGPFSQRIDATPYQGQDFRLRAAMRVDVAGDGNQGQFWFRVDRPDGDVGFFDNMADRPVTDPEWGTYEITGRIDDDASAFMFGGFLHGEGRLWADDFHLSVKAENGEWREVPIYNSSFEVSGLEPVGWFGNADRYRFDIAANEPYRGAHALAVTSDLPAVPGAIFDTVPPPGTIIDKPLGAGLRAMIPIALTDAVASSATAAAVPELDVASLTATDASLRFAGVIIGWNVLQHFYPYFDVGDANWSDVLPETLADARDDETGDDYMKTLRRMVATLDDGHGYVAGTQAEPRPAGMPFRLGWIEDRVVVTQTAVPDAVQVGDVLLSIEGRPVAEVLDEEVQLASGTLRWKRYRQLQRLGLGPEGGSIEVALDRGGERHELAVARGHPGTPDYPLKPIDTVAGNIRYVDLTRAEWTDIAEVLDQLATAPGVIFDLRGYPNGNHAILSYLIDEPVQSAIWNVPQVVYPDRENVAGWDQSGRWIIVPREPRIQGRVAFITDVTAISYAESVLGIVEHYKLGKIVGQATAGTNGNINTLPLPGGFRIIWTGMKVLKHDGSQHHLVGILPDVPVEQTIANVRNGNDEMLAAAIDLIQGN